MEIQKLTDRYRLEGAAKLAQELGRSVDSITGRARTLQLQSHFHRQHQAEHRAMKSPSVNARFFDALSPTVAWVGGVLYVRASIKLKHRHVIKIRMPSDRKWVLTETLKCMECRHRIKLEPRSVVVEIASSYLVRSFLNRIGYLPTRHTKRLELPPIPEEVFPSFAAGWLAARGQQSKNLVTWTGLKPAVAALSTEIQKQVFVGNPQWDYGTCFATIIWSKPDDVANIQDWLAGQSPN